METFEIRISLIHFVHLEAEICNHAHQHRFLYIANLLNTDAAAFSICKCQLYLHHYFLSLSETSLPPVHQSRRD